MKVLLPLWLLTAALGPVHAEAPPASVAALAWMAGSWGATVKGVVLEEHWIAPRGELMLGLHRDLFPSGKVFFEYLRIEIHEEQVSYIPSPGGRESVAFRLSEIGQNRVVFTNPDHDFPQSITYWLTDDRTLRCRVEGLGGDGEPRSEEWAWDRQ